MFMVRITVTFFQKLKENRDENNRNKDSLPGSEKRPKRKLSSKLVMRDDNQPA